MDTEGDPLPKDVKTFFARGAITAQQLQKMQRLITKKNIAWCFMDAGDLNAGSISLVLRATKNKTANQYRMYMNQNHAPAIQFATLAHELGHLFLGHLGEDSKLKVPAREPLTHAQREIEAESVSYIVCSRNGITSKAEAYLAHYVSSHTDTNKIDLYQITRAAGQVETLLGLGAKLENTPTKSTP